MHSIHKSRIPLVVVLISLLSSAVITNGTKSSIGVNKQVLNLSNLLGSRTNTPAYERILSQPVFQVTTGKSAFVLFCRVDIKLFDCLCKHNVLTEVTLISYKQHGVHLTCFLKSIKMRRNQ